jgi:hypothetical protein
MSSQAISYPSPAEGHTPHAMGSPTPSQLLLHRVASPNHIAAQRLYADSPRSVPVDYSQQYPSQEQQQQQFEYDQSQEIYVNDDHIYDFGPNGALPVEPQFVQSQPPQPSEAASLMFNVPQQFCY